MKKILYILPFIAGISFAQNPAPAPAQKEAVIVMNGRAHIGNGQVIENSVIGFENGKIILVADATRVRIDGSKYKVRVDAAGKDVYPGFIETNSTLGITEIDLVRSTRDYYEVGENNPNIRSLIAYNTDSKIQPTVRSNGVLMAQVVPQGGVLSGQSSVVQLDAWNWEDAAYKADDAIHVNWPRMFIVKGSPEEEQKQKDKMQKDLANIDFLFREAKAYSLTANPQEKNVRYEAMKGLFNGTKKLFVHCDYVKEILNAVDFSKKYNLQIVIVGGYDAFRVADVLKNNNIPVILGRTHALPGREDDDYDLPYKIPYLLKSAGVNFAISVDGSWQSRNLMFNAGTAVAFGLTKEEALAAITSSAAKILGIESTVGTLEEGKDATLFISTGDALDMRTNNVERAFIAGRDINLDNIQKQLYERYVSKFGLKK